MENERRKITFWGQELSEEELKYHRMSYKTLSSQFQCVLCNNITEVDDELFDNLECGELSHYETSDGEYLTEEELSDRIEELQELDAPTKEDEAKLEELYNLEEEYEEIFQYYIVSDNALWYLKRAKEIVFYSRKLDCYIWGVTHWGTSWDYVLTCIKYNDTFSMIED